MASEIFFAKLDKIVDDELSPPSDERLEEVEPEEYYAKVGHDGKGLRVPADLDQSICSYMALSGENVRSSIGLSSGWIWLPPMGYLRVCILYSAGLSNRVTDRAR